MGSEMCIRDRKRIGRFAENSPLQQRLATYRSIRNSSNGENPGKILPASHPASPAKRKSDTEDALAIVNRKGRPHLFMTVTMNANWPEITSNLLPGKTAYDRPDLCCRVFNMKSVRPLTGPFGSY